MSVGFALVYALQAVKGERACYKPTDCILRGWIPDEKPTYGEITYDIFRTFGLSFVFRGWYKQEERGL